MKKPSAIEVEKLRRHNSEEMETIVIRLSLEKFPIAFERKVLELMSGGMTRLAAISFINKTPFLMEAYYSTGNGLFLVESEAVESDGIPLHDPYTGEELDEVDLDD